MQTGLAALALKKLSDRRKRAALMIGAMGVVFATTYALILPALTIDQEAAEQQPGMAVEQVEAADQAAGQDQAAAEATESAEAAAPEADAAEAPAAATAPNAQGEGAEGAEGAGESAAGEAANNATSDQEAGQSSAESNVTVSADGYAAGTLTATNGKYQAEVTFAEDAKLPEGTTLKITPLKAEGAEYQEAYNKLVAQKQAVDASFDPAAFEYTVVDITLYDAEGNEIEPAAPVQVKLTTPSTVEGAKPADVQVHHLNDQTNKVEVVAGEGTGSIKLGEATVSEFQVDSFSKFVVETIAAATTAVPAAATPVPAAAGDVVLSFNLDGGSGKINSISGQPYTRVTLPNYTGTKRGYKFVGYTESTKYLGKGIQGEPGEKNPTIVFKQGDEYVLGAENVTLYAVWQSNNQEKTNAHFYIRKDGVIINEPGAEAAAGAYTANAVIKQNAIRYQYYVLDNNVSKNKHENHVENDVVASLNHDQLPTNDEIKSIWPDYNPDTDYVLWYVQKYRSSNDTDGTKGRWHVDGVVLKRELVGIAYDHNLPSGVTVGSLTTPVPNGRQVEKGTEVTVGANYVGPGKDNSKIQTPVLTGYTFIGWNTKPDGTGTAYAQRNPIKLYEDTVLYAMWLPDNQNSLMIHKQDESSKSLIGSIFTVRKISDSASYEINLSQGASASWNHVETGAIYKVTETQAPAGYKMLASSFNFVVKNVNGSLTAYACDERGEKVDAPTGVTVSYDNGVKIVVKNEPYLTDVVLKKVDGSGNPLPGATFQLKKGQAVLDSYGSIQPAGTDASVTLENLRDGSYTLIETGAPDGYIQVAQPIEFTIKNGVVSFTNNANSGVTFTAATNNNPATFTVTNQAGQALPNTGGPGTHLHTFFGALLVLLAAGGMYVSRRRLAGRGGN